jgi:group II intron reverse transcriptase/maturase
MGVSTPPSDEKNRVAHRENLIEQMTERGNLKAAWKKVRRNGGSAGIDGRDMDATLAYLNARLGTIKAQLSIGTYRPDAVKRVEIEKPGGGIRKLGVPTILDRVLQQAALQILSPLFDPLFSEHSYGFRPGRSAGQAVEQAQKYQIEGKNWVVDMDLKSFFDEVNHDLLMARVRRHVKDKAMLKLIRSIWGYVDGRTASA